MALDLSAELPTGAHEHDTPTTRELVITNGLSPPVQHEPAVMRHHRRVESRWP